MSSKHDSPNIHAPTVSTDEGLLANFGYRQELKRAIGGFTSFCVAFSIISAATAVFTTFGFGLTTAGPAFVWAFPLAAVVQLLWVLVAADLATKIPLAGYAYQWASRLVNRDFGWFTGYVALLGWIAGMTGVTYTLAGYFGGLIGLDVTLRVHVFLTVAFMLLVMLINIVGVRIATRINNVGATIEVIVTLGGTLAFAITVFAFLQPAQDLSFLFSKGEVTQSPYVFAWLTSALTGLFGLLGSSSAADVAEETKDTRRTIPRTMFVAFAGAVLTEFVMYLVFTLAIPDLGTANTSATPITYIMQSYVGSLITALFIALILVSIFACSIANMLVITRLVYSLARDQMLPFSGFFGRVNQRFRAPVNAIIAMGALSCAFVLSALLAEQAVGYIVGLASLAFFSVFLLMTAGSWYALRKGRLPSSGGAFFDLGRWRQAIYGVGCGAFVVTVLALSLLPAYRSTGRNMLIALGIGAGWYLLRLRGKIKRGDAGVPATATESEGAGIGASRTLPSGGVDPKSPDAASTG